MNAQAWVADPIFATGLLNLRDAYKANMRTCILLGPAFTLPAELRQDVMLLDEPMPDDETLGTVVKKIHKFAKLDPPSEQTKLRAVDAVRGLSTFAAEQVIAMSVVGTGLDFDLAWARKRAAVNQTRGLTITTDGPTFDVLGGLERAIEFGHGLR